MKLLSLSLFLSSAINEASPKSVLRSQVPSEHWSGDMRLVLEIQRCNYSQLNSQKNNSIPTWSSALKFSLVLQLPSLRTCLSKKGPFVGCGPKWAVESDLATPKVNWVADSEAFPGVPKRRAIPGALGSSISNDFFWIKSTYQFWLKDHGYPEIL